MLAVLHVEEVWQPDRMAEAQAVLRHHQPRAPGRRRPARPDAPVLRRAAGSRASSCRAHYDFRPAAPDPGRAARGVRPPGLARVVAFQTRNPMHRAHQELTLRAAKEVEANLLIHPVGGHDQARRRRPLHAGAAATRRSSPALPAGHGEARAAAAGHAHGAALARRSGTPSSARTTAARTSSSAATTPAPAATRSGKPFYGPYDAQELLRAHEAELGRRHGPVPEDGVRGGARTRYVPEDEVPAGASALDLSGTELRRRLADGGARSPSWFTFPAVVEGAAAHPSAAARARASRCSSPACPARASRRSPTCSWSSCSRWAGAPVTLLDGDLVRKHLSSELGFSKEHRDINIRRIGYVASEITKNGGIAICAPIAPYDCGPPSDVRDMIEPVGGFVLVHVATPLEVCEQRDRKGLYAKARAGIIKEFTGISDPYEAPRDAEVVIDTEHHDRRSRRARSDPPVPGAAGMAVPGNGGRPAGSAVRQVGGRRASGATLRPAPVGPPGVVIPTVFIVGGPRCGTTSLAAYLGPASQDVHERAEGAAPLRLGPRHPRAPLRRPAKVPGALRRRRRRAAGRRGVGAVPLLEDRSPGDPGAQPVGENHHHPAGSRGDGALDARAQPAAGERGSSGPRAGARRGGGAPAGPADILDVFRSGGAPVQGPREVCGARSTVPGGLRPRPGEMHPFR